MNDLILNVDALEEANQPFEADLPRDFLEEVLRTEPPTEFHAAGLAHVRGEATKMGRKVLVRGRFNVPIEGQCKRCLKPVKLDESVDLFRAFVPGEQPVAGKRNGTRPGEARDEEGTEATFALETVDEESYSGKEIDLRPAIREQVLLSVPPSPLCREDCKGLCPVCGKDLNEGDCGHDKKVPDPRWAALKDLQLGKKES